MNMKKLFLTALLAVAMTATSAQKPFKVYCLVSYHLPEGYMYIDFGLKEKVNLTCVPKESAIVDENGKKIVSSSHVATLNLMSSLGWKVEENMSTRLNSVIDPASSARYMPTVSWYMSKEVNSIEELTTGLATAGEWERLNK